MVLLAQFHFFASWGCVVPCSLCFLILETSWSENFRRWLAAIWAYFCISSGHRAWMLSLMVSYSCYICWANLSIEGFEVRSTSHPIDFVGENRHRLADQNFLRLWGDIMPPILRRGCVRENQASRTDEVRAQLSSPDGENVNAQLWAGNVKRLTQVSYFVGSKMRKHLSINIL